MKIGTKLLKLHEVVLKQIGANPSDFLHVSSTADNYKFVHKSTEKRLDVRR